MFVTSCAGFVARFSVVFSFCSGRKVRIMVGCSYVLLFVCVFDGV